jgi:hypothetical protein
MSKEDLYMPLPSRNLPRLIAGLALICTAITPLGAENWQAFGKTERMTSRIDLDALKRDGSQLTYRLELTYPNDPRRAGWRAISNSVIDCTTGMRKHISGETYLPDGTVRKAAGASRWYKFREGDFAAGVRDRFCTMPASSTPS